MSYYAHEEEDDVLVQPTASGKQRSSSKRSKRRSSSKKGSRNYNKANSLLVESFRSEDDEADKMNGAALDDNNNVTGVPDETLVVVGTSDEAINNNTNTDNNDHPRMKSKERRSKSRERRHLRAKKPQQQEDDNDDDDDDVGLNKRGFFAKRKGSSNRKSRSRQARVYDDVYGTDYAGIVDDGIVGCADSLCVNRADVFDDDTGGGGKNKSAKAKAKHAAAVAAAEAKNNNIISSSTSMMDGGDTSKSLLASPNTGEPNKMVDDSEEVYVVRQRYGYFSIFFGVIQIIVLALMMWQCGIAPMSVNPMFGPYPDALSEWGGKNSILIVEDGEWWRLFTPILLHAGVIHLLCNVAVQLELGVFFEREWGSMTWLIIYMTSALGSSVLSVITMPDAVSVGSSGAVMGLFGGKLAEIICRSCEQQDTAQQRVAYQVRKEQCMGVTCSVIVVLAFSFIPYVDWAAHLGGLLSGFFVGFMTFSFHLESYCYRLLWFVVGMALTLGFFIPCIDIMYSGDIVINEELRDVCGYYQQYFEDYECNCMREEYLENLANGNYFGYYNGGDDDGGGGGGDDDGANGGERFLYQLAKYYGL